MYKKILIRGKPGIGKTTLIKKLLPRLKTYFKEIKGFYTEEKRKNNERIGFDIVEIDGEVMSLARINVHKRLKVGKYGVFVENIDMISERLLNFLENYLNKKSAIFVVDEFGKMEFLSTKFIEFSRKIFTGDYNLIGTIPVYPIKYLKSFLTKDIYLFDIDKNNRDNIEKEIEKLWL